MREPALGEAATQLPWLSPGAASLLALIRLPAAQAWAEVRRDPGAVLLILRQAARGLATPAVSFFPALLRDPVILEGALRFLSCPGFANWNQPAIRPIYHTSLSIAWLAERLAVISRRSDPDNAWAAGLLSPVGWMAVAAVDSDRAAACLADPELPSNPAKAQQRHWGLEQAGITRRLLRAWRLPRWLVLVLAHLGLPVEVAQSLGADPDLLRIVQLAVGLAAQQGHGLHLAVAGEPAANAAALGLSFQEQEALRESVACGRMPVADEQESRITDWTSPAEVPHLRDLLTLAADNLRWRDSPAQEQLERECDQLHQTLQDQRRGEAERLQNLKLHALAEFAAGAAHEVNNPLAVISGQAQYLLGREEDLSRQRALQAIVNQTQRIHQVLTELMQFARPSRPQREIVDVPSLVREAALALGDLAKERDVRLVCAEPEQAVNLFADRRQIRTALECLLRNAIEAAPPGGWARLHLQTPAPDRLEMVVEDSGSGPGPEHREHLFDPFYSGRQAGRGRGLGLSTAWRLAREHGGDVRFDDLSGGPTRFVLSLPCQASDGLPWKADGNEQQQPSNGCAKSSGQSEPRPLGSGATPTAP